MKRKVKVRVTTTPRATKIPRTVQVQRVLRRIRTGIHAELANIQREWVRHEKKRGRCSSQCTDKMGFQERVATLNWVLEQIGGQPVNDNVTVIDDYDGLPTKFIV